MPVYPSDTLVSVAESKSGNSRALSPERADAAREFVKAALERRNCNQFAYSKVLGFSQTRLNDFMNGKTQGGMSLVEAIADAEGVSLDAVVGRSGAVAAPKTVKERAALAATLLGYSPSVVEAGLAKLSTASPVLFLADVPVPLYL